VKNEYKDAYLAGVMLAEVVYKHNVVNRRGCGLSKPQPAAGTVLFLFFIF
jgi:hypothetical protein